jgi:[pyruvate, water dikinase]-phosphate phosphotransferase / [pyruvate, water dikinase] kinase
MADSKNRKIAPLYVVSGGKGLAGNSVLQSVLIQFPENNVPVFVVPDVVSQEKVEEVIARAIETGGAIVHTMVVPGIREIIKRLCKEKNVRNFDLVGDLSDYISEMLDEKPVSIPGLFRMANREYFNRIEAIEFTMAHDDGLNPDKLHQADIILTGVSRTGKTPLSIYLAMFGWKVANVPLVNKIDPPEQLRLIDKRRVFGLTISLNPLLAQRQNRIKNYPTLVNSAYVDMIQVQEELDFAEKFFRRNDFTIIDVTDKPVETTGNDITNLITQRFKTENWQIKPKN